MTLPAELYLQDQLYRRYPPPLTGEYYRVAGDEDIADWDFMSRTVVVGDGQFDQLPSVMRYSPFMEYKPGDYRVDETPFKAAYIAINNYDGDGLRRCENYLWKSDTALYNNQGFPKRQYLTMSGSLLKKIDWAKDVLGREYLKFETLKPTDNVAGMTYQTHPHFVHRFDLVFGHDHASTGHTPNTPRGLVYYYLTSKEGFGFFPKRYVKGV